MFLAINKLTGVIIHSIAQEYSEKFMKNEEWYAHPSYIEEFPETLDKTKIDVKFRKGNDLIINKFGTEYSKYPHFYIPNATELGIKIKKDTEEHKLAVNLICNLLKMKEFNFYYSINKDDQVITKNNIKLSELNLNINKIEIESITKLNFSRIVDIRIPLNNFSEIFGSNIAFEIQLSNETDNTKKQRSYERALLGYSLVWISKEDIEKINEINEFELLTNSILIHSFKKDAIIDIKDQIYAYTNLIDKKINEFNMSFTEKCNNREQNLIDYIENCKKYFKDNEIPRIINCSACKGTMTIKNGKYGYFYGCNNFPICKKVIKIGGIDEKNKIFNRLENG